MLKRSTACCVIAVAAWLGSCLSPAYSRTAALDVWMLDVGQGESMLLHEPTGHWLLFDGGPSDVVLSRIGSILPPWQRHIDLVIISHNHTDHIRGLLSVLERYTVGEIWLSGAVHRIPEYSVLQDDIRQQHIPTRVVWFDRARCASVCPPAYPFGASTLQVYHPLRNMTGADPDQPHDADVVVKASYGDQSVLLAGDLNEEHEQAILTACTMPCNLQATLLQVPHHGSATGLLPAFLTTIAPLEAWIPVGDPNPYSHPTKVILDRLKQANIPTHRTDREGTLHTVFPGGP